MLIILVLASILLFLEIRLPDLPPEGLWSEVVRVILSGFFAGLLVAFIEEVFFRGALYSAVRDTNSAFLAIGLTSAFYAVMHFVGPVAVEGTAMFSWTSGLQMLWAGVQEFSFSNVFDSLIALFATGVFLALVREKTGNIAYCIGLHAGWIAAIKLFKHLTQKNPASEYAFLVGEYNGVIGYLALGWLALLSTGYLFLFRKKGGHGAGFTAPGTLCSR